MSSIIDLWNWLAPGGNELVQFAFTSCSKAENIHNRCVMVIFLSEMPLYNSSVHAFTCLQCAFINLFWHKCDFFQFRCQLSSLIGETLWALPYFNPKRFLVLPSAVCHIILRIVWTGLSLGGSQLAVASLCIALPQFCKHSEHLGPELAAMGGGAGLFWAGL